MPLDEIAGGGDRDDDAGAGVVAEAPADELGHGPGGGAAEFGEQRPPPAQERGRPVDKAMGLRLPR
jgi:hypothetical protein